MCVNSEMYFCVSFLWYFCVFFFCYCYCRIGIAQLGTVPPPAFALRCLHVYQIHFYIFFEFFFFKKKVTNFFLYKKKQPNVHKNIGFTVFDFEK